MHIHGSSPNLYVANIYAAGNDPRSLASHRAAESRRKLARAAQVTDAATPEEIVLIRHWLDTSAPAPHNPYASHPARASDFD